MELTDALLAQIGAYLAGQMNESDRQAFEIRIRQDADLQREVVLQHELKQGLSLLAEKQRFKTMHTDLARRGMLPPASQPEIESVGTVIPFPAPTLAHRRPLWNTVTVAASVVLLVGIGLFIFWKQEIPNPDTMKRDKAFYSAFTPDLKPAPYSPIDPDRLGAALPYPVENQDSVQLQQGISLLQQQRLQPAIARLQPIAQGLPGHWRASAQWFLALAYLKNGQPAQTDSLLTLIAESGGHPYQLEARHLTSQLPHPPARYP